MTPPARLWKREEQRLRTRHVGICSSLSLRRCTRKGDSRRRYLAPRFLEPSDRTIRFISIAFILLLQMVAQLQPAEAASSLRVSTLPGSDHLRGEVDATEKSSSDLKNVLQGEAATRDPLTAAGVTFDARESPNNTVAIPITAENFFSYHRWGSNGNLSCSSSGMSEHNIESSRQSKEETANEGLQRTDEEAKDRGEAIPALVLPTLPAPLGNSATATGKSAVISYASAVAAATKPTVATTGTVVPTKEVTIAPALAAGTEAAATETRAETEKTAASATTEEVPATDNATTTDKAAATDDAAAATPQKTAEATTGESGKAPTATEAEAKKAARKQASEGAETAKTVGAEKTKPRSEGTWASRTTTRGVLQGVLEPEASLLGGLRSRKKGMEPSLQDVAALAAAAAAAVAALNHGDLEYTDIPEGLDDMGHFLGFHNTLRRTRGDTVEQPPMEPIQKLTQMVQEAREEDLGIFDPVDSKGKKTIILKEWYTTTVASTMVGRRESDEDALLVSAPSAVREDVRFKAVFDGHGGEQTSEYCADNVARYLGVLDSFSFEAVKDACLRMDADVLRAFGPRNVAGSTGVIAILEKVHSPLKVAAFGREIIPEDPAEAAAFIPVELQLQQEERAEDPLSASRYSLPLERSVTLGPDAFLLTLVNVGDSRAMLFHEDGTFTRLSKDHKPNNLQERNRVERAGGFVSNAANDVPRVDGVLALSRAFGDSDFKAEAHLPPDQQRVVAVPDVRHFYVLPSDMLVMACDGLFEPFGMDWKYLHDVAVEELRASNDLERMVSRMMDYAFTMNSHDNISVVATTFHKKKIKEPAVVYKSISGTGEVIDEAKLPEGSDAFSYAAVNEGIFSLH